MKTSKEQTKLDILNTVKLHEGQTTEFVAQCLEKHKTYIQHLMKHLIDSRLLFRTGSPKEYHYFSEPQKEEVIIKGNITRRPAREYSGTDIVAECKSTIIYRFDALIRQARENYGQPI